MKIVIPTDFSNNAQNAIDYAIGMFRQEDVHYILLNAYIEPLSSADMLVSINDILEKQSQRGILNEFIMLSKKYPELASKIEQRCCYGQLANVMHQLVEDENIDFVVMGTKGTSNMKKKLMGSNTVNVMRTVNCPVIAVPEKARYKPPVHIAFATDYKKLPDNMILSPLAMLVRKHNSNLLVLNVQSEGEIAKADQVVENIKLHFILENIPHKFYNMQYKHTIEGINQFIHDNQIDLLAMVARQHNFFKKLLSTSTTKQMTMNSDIPLLIMHEHHGHENN